MPISVDKILADQRQERDRRVEGARAALRDLKPRDVVRVMIDCIDFMLDADDVTAVVEHAVAHLSTLRSPPSTEPSVPKPPTDDAEAAKPRYRVAILPKWSMRQHILIALGETPRLTTGGIRRAIEAKHPGLTKDNNMGSDVKRAKDAGFIEIVGKKSVPGRQGSWPIYALTKQGEVAAASLLSMRATIRTQDALPLLGGDPP